MTDLPSSETPAATLADELLTLDTLARNAAEYPDVAAQLVQRIDALRLIVTDERLTPAGLKQLGRTLEDFARKHQNAVASETPAATRTPDYETLRQKVEKVIRAIPRMTASAESGMIYYGHGQYLSRADVLMALDEVFLRLPALEPAAASLFETPAPPCALCGRLQYRHDSDISDSASPGHPYTATSSLLKGSAT